MRAFALSVLAICLVSGPVSAAELVFASPEAAREELVIYSTLDARLAEPLVTAFQAAHPATKVVYHDLLSGEITARIIAETDKQGETADFVFSSAMDSQVKLANDGYARPISIPESKRWPRWANWRDMAFAITFEPGVLVYHRPDFPDGPPTSRQELMRWLQTEGQRTPGRVGTYDIARSAVGYLFLARDVEHFADIWTLVHAMGKAGLQTFPTSQDIIDRVADGRMALGYNILGSYAADQVRQHPDLGMELLRDYTVVVSRVALVPRAARNPELGAQFLAFMMSREGQLILSEKLRLPAISLEVSGENSARAMQEALGDLLRPVPVSPGLLVYLDQATRQHLIGRWNAALAPD